MLHSLIKLINSFSKKLRDDYVSAFSAQAAFFLIISFFPFTMFLLTLLNYLPFSTPDIVAAVQEVFPETISEYVGQLLVELLEKSSGTVLSLTAIAALWSSSKGFYSVVRGLDSIYRSNARKNYFVARALAALYTLLFALLLIVVLFIFVFGNQIYLWSLKFLPILSAADYQRAHHRGLRSDDPVLFPDVHDPAGPQILFFCGASGRNHHLGRLAGLFLSVLFLHRQFQQLFGDLRQPDRCRALHALVLFLYVYYVHRGGNQPGSLQPRDPRGVPEPAGCPQKTPYEPQKKFLRLQLGGILKITC